MIAAKMTVIDHNNSMEINVRTMVIDRVDLHHQVEPIAVETSTDLLATMTRTIVEIGAVRDLLTQAHNVAAIEIEAQAQELARRMKMAYFKFLDASPQWFLMFKLS